MIKVFFVYLIAFSLAYPSNAMAQRYFYRMKQDELVSNLLYRAELKPIYKKKGTLKILQTENKNNISDINKVQQGDKIYFPKFLVETALSLNTINIINDEEIIVKKTFMRKPANESVSAAIEVIPTVVLPAPAKDTVPVVVTEIPVKDCAPIASLPARQSQPSPTLSEAQSEVSISLQSGFSRIDSTQNLGTATLLSKPEKGINLTWQQNWSQDWKSYIHWGYLNSSYENTSAGVIAGSQSASTSEFSFGAKYKMTENFSMGLEIGSREIVFIPSYSQGTATIETKPITFYKLSALHTIAEVRKLKLAAQASTSYLMPASTTNYNILSGLDYFGGLLISHKLKKYLIFASGEYGQTTQNTSLATQSRKEIRTFLGLSFFIDDEVQP